MDRASSTGYVCIYVWFLYPCQFQKKIIKPKNEIIYNKIINGSKVISFYGVIMCIRDIFCMCPCYLNQKPKQQQKWKLFRDVKMVVRIFDQTGKPLYINCRLIYSTTVSFFIIQKLNCVIGYLNVKTEGNTVDIIDVQLQGPLK